ncbi:MAG: serine/threonine-protein kinase PknK [Deltaproteobacteria bacterium]|nr:serine/threonine-protein kinase PknK [Deltaproteobacteria bacterium]
MSADEIPELPTLPERYLARRLIGDGATGEVFLARDQVLGVDVALKIVKKNLALHRRFRARFFREVSLSAQIVQRHLVPVHDFGELSDGRPFVALAFAELGSLRDLFRRGFRVGDLLLYMEQVCWGLAALHAHGLVHQDLKPANILLHKTGPDDAEVWVADLGVADDLGQIARDVRRVGGTPTYMAPEQLEGKPQEFGPWTDLYALGLILWESLCGKRPHGSGESRKQLLDARLEEPPGLRPLPGVEVPDELEDLILNLLDPEPRQRYDRAADVRRALRGIRERMGQRDTYSQEGGEDGDGELTDIMSSGAMPVPEEIVGRRPQKRPELRWRKVPPEPLPPLPPPEPPQPSGAKASLALLAVRDVPLVAREQVLEILWRQAREVVTQRGPRVVLIIGTEGSGKTRLVEHIARALDEGGWMEAFRLRYQRPAGVDDGYLGAVRELLSPFNDTRLRLQERLTRWVARDRETTLELARDDAQILARWCGYLLPGEQAPNAALGLRFLVEEIDARAWRGGACVVLDDVEHAEEPGDGLDFCEALLEGAVGRRPALVLATIAQESLDGSPALLDRVKAMQELGALRLDLPALTPEQIRGLLDEALTLDEALARVVTKRVAMFPLAAGMLLRQAAARGLLKADEQLHYRLKPGLKINDVLPVNLTKLYAYRLTSAVRATEDPVEAAIALASVALAGQTPPVGVLRDVSEPGLDALLAAGLLREEGGLLRFEHGALQRTARKMAEELADSIEIHEKLAAAWQRHGEQTGVDVDLPWGLHLLRCGQPEAALGPLLRSVRSMLNQGRYSAAIRSAELAISAADLTESPENPNLSTRAEARRLKGAALLELDRPAEADKAARAALILGPLDRLTRGRLLALQARAEADLGQPESARRLAKLARADLEAVADKDGLAEAVWAEAVAANHEDDVVAAQQCLRRLVELRPAEHPLGVKGWDGLFHLAARAGRLDEANLAVERLNYAANSTGDTRAAARAAMAEGTLAARKGAWAVADQKLRAARANAATCSEPQVQLDALIALGELALRAEDRLLARERFTRAARLAERWCRPVSRGRARAMLALMAMNERQLEPAEAEARRAAEALALHPRDQAWATIGLVRATCAAVARQAPAARQWWSLARERGLGQRIEPLHKHALVTLCGAMEGLELEDMEPAVWEALAVLTASQP